MCWACAQAALVTARGRRCSTCEQPLRAGACPNFWCGRPDRGFDVIWTIALHVGVLRRVIAAYKYRRASEWAGVLGRLVAGYLTEHAPWFEEFELIAACPGLPTPGRPWDHVGAIVDEAAAAAGELWPFDAGPVRCVVKTGATVPLMGAGAPASRRLWAACDLRPALTVPDPDRVRGRQILVVDDVFTDGSTLREVALALRDAGAAGVSGLMLARQPWRS